MFKTFSSRNWIERSWLFSTKLNFILYPLCSNSIHCLKRFNFKVEVTHGVIFFFFFTLLLFKIQNSGGFNPLLFPINRGITQPRFCNSSKNLKVPLISYPRFAPKNKFTFCYSNYWYPPRPTTALEATRLNIHKKGIKCKHV